MWLQLCVWLLKSLAFVHLLLEELRLFGCLGDASATGMLYVRNPHRFTKWLWKTERNSTSASTEAMQRFIHWSISSKRWSAKGNNQITPALVRIDMKVFELQKISFIWIYSFICHYWKCRNKVLPLLMKWFLTLRLPPTVRNAKGLFRNNATMASLLSEPIISNGLHGATIAYCLTKHSSVWAVSTGRQRRPVPKVSEHKIILSWKAFWHVFSCISSAVLSKHKIHSYMISFLLSWLRPSIEKSAHLLMNQNMLTHERRRLVFYMFYMCNGITWQ